MSLKPLNVLRGIVEQAQWPGNFSDMSQFSCILGVIHSISDVNS